MVEGLLEFASVRVCVFGFKGVGRSVTHIFHLHIESETTNLAGYVDLTEPD